MLLLYAVIHSFSLGTFAHAFLQPIHYTISRRGGSFPAPDTVNLTLLLDELQIVERRLNATTRGFSGNKVVRKPKRLKGTQASTILLGDVGRAGNWFADLHIGEPVQQVDMDLDMLTADWWVFSTSSGTGSFYLDFNSKTFVDAESPSIFPTCREPTDMVHLPTVNRVVPITFALCRPAKQWVRTLLPSGAYLGLAPSESLSQTKTKSLLAQLMEKDIIDSPIWSIVLLNGKEGLFSIGGTSAASVKLVQRELEESLARLEKRDGSQKQETLKQDSGERTKLKQMDSSKDWKWNEVHGAEGWWQILLQGVWIDGVKILNSQPIILDVNTPFIIAPPVAARLFYASISGSRQLSPPYDQFHAYPCFNPPKIHFEFGGWNVEVLKGKREKGTFSPGGRLSIGRMNKGSGYCIGVIVESRVEEEDGGNGLSDVWIVGEPFFRDVQVAFDWKEKNVGLQRV